MKTELTSEFMILCQEILAENKTEAEWAEIESSDMFQSENHCGGFDATEMAFCFSYYDPDRNEFWFQLTLEDIRRVCDRKLTVVETRPVG